MEIQVYNINAPWFLPYVIYAKLQAGKKRTGWSRVLYRFYFFEIKGDLNEPETIWGNLEVYMKAFNRMNRFLQVKDNRFRWDIKNGAEIGISENIFNHIVSEWDNSNKKLETGDYEILKPVGSDIYMILPRNREEVAE